MDAGTPNPNKPRLSRRLLSHFTLTLSVLLALSFVTLAVVGPTTQEAEAIAPIVIPAVLLGVAIGAYIANWLDESSDNAVWEADKNAYAGSLIASFETARDYSNSAIWNDAQLFNSHTYKYVRFAEYAAKQLYDNQNASGSSYNYDPIFVLTESGILQEIIRFVKFADDLYNTLYPAWSNIQDNFVGSLETMSYGFGLYTYSTGFQSYLYSNIDIDKSLLAIHTNRLNSGDNAYLYLSEESNVTVLNTDLATRTITVNFIAPNGTTVKTVSKSALARELITCDIADLPTGSYKITTSGVSGGAVVFGEAIGALTNGGSISNACLYGELIDGKYVVTAYAIKNAGNTYYTSNNLVTSSLVTDAEPNNIKIGFNTGSKTFNANGGPANVSVGVLHDLTLYKANLTSQISTMLTTVNNFAQSKYNMIVANGGMDLPDPSVVFPNLDDLEGYTWEQIYAIYIAYLNAMQSHFYNYTQMGLDDVNISAESLKLKVRGSITDSSGHLLADSTSIFTPFISYGNEFLEIGENTWQSAGWVIIWGNGTCENISTPTLKYMELAKNYTLDIVEIVYDGQQVDSITLTVDRLSLILPGGIIPPTPPHGNILTDAEWLLSHWYYFAIVAGIICMLAAISLRNTAVIVIGLILLAAGGIGYWMAGDFSLLDGLGLSLEPPNLREWLQQLR